MDNRSITHTHSQSHTHTHTHTLTHTHTVTHTHSHTHTHFNYKCVPETILKLSNEIKAQLFKIEDLLLNKHRTL